MTDTTPPPFFKTGLKPATRFAIFALSSVILMLADARFGYLDPLRQVLAVIVNPLQHAVNAPVRLAGQVGAFFVTQGRLRLENDELKEARLRLSGQLMEFQALQAENAHLRALFKARERYGTRVTLAEILYSERDPFARKIIIDRGSLHHVVPGQVVVDEVGVVGQVTRVYPGVSEVTLITDKNQAVPVQNLRNGLRAVVFGSGQDGSLTVPFMPIHADLQPGDQLVTSGLDGIYPPGLPVATVLRVERNAAYPFARITCLPVAGVDRHRQVLVLASLAPAPPPRPQPVEVSRGKR
ncbi:rod shape-determining protein MreC [Thiobacter aerophilum]|uniref:Cell shape-determining protein MreC n=1 Tax=Thiobacter aerophilum TaxID=3121275 RepID=A0ABV0EGU4_9BURK